MKRFDFRLEQVLRWRTALAGLRKAEALTRAKAVAEAEREIEQLRLEQAEAARQLAAQSDGFGLAAYAGFLERWRWRIAKALARLNEARKEFKTATEKLVEADRNARLLEKLKEAEFKQWTAETEREIEAFAAESFLNRR